MSDRVLVDTISRVNTHASHSKSVSVTTPSRRAMAGAVAVPQACHPHDWSDSLVCYGRSAVEKERARPVLMMQGRRSKPKEGLSCVTSPAIIRRNIGMKCFFGKNSKHRGLYGSFAEENGRGMGGCL